MTLAPPRDDVQDVIRTRLRQHFAEREGRAGAYGTEFTNLWRMANDLIVGGKLIRPRLFLDLYHSLAGATPSASPQVVEDAAAAIEMLHYSFLLHDDVIDGDLLRRSVPNLIGCLRDQHPELAANPDVALHWGETGAVLMGDLLLSDVHQLFARFQLDDARRTAALDLLDHTVTESMVGELTDVGLAAGLIAGDLKTVLAMSARKTATYTFEFPFRLATILAGSAPELGSHLAAVGAHFGLAYQLQDDLLSTFGDPEVHGKDALSDLREGKLTPVIAYARLSNSWPAIEPRFGASDLTVEEAAEIRTTLTACGAEAFVRSLVDEQFHTAHNRIAEAADAGILPDAARAVVTGIAERIDGRTS